MSVRAYRVIKIERAPEGSSFNLWHDEGLMNWLRDNTEVEQHLDQDGGGMIEISVEDMKRAIQEANIDAETVKNLERDIQATEKNGGEFIIYDCF